MSLKRKDRKRLILSTGITDMGYSDDMKDMNSLESQICDYITDLFSVEKAVVNVSVYKKEDLYHIRVVSTKVGKMVGKKGWVLRLISDALKCKFNIKPSLHIIEKNSDLKSIPNIEE